MNLTFGELMPPDDTEPQCLGLKFRYTYNAYSLSDKFVFRKQISLLKKLSCRGCEKCGPILDDMEQGIADIGEEFFEFSPTLKHNDIVQLVFVPGRTDWESGYLDSWHYKVVKCPSPAAKSVRPVKC